MEELDFRRAIRVRSCRGVRERAIIRAEIDADDELRHGAGARSYSTSSSAGASTAASCLPSGGRFTEEANQPRWRSVPPGAFPFAGTLPMSLIRLGSGALDPSSF